MQEIKLLDITGPEFDPPDCPDWAKETVPAALQPYRGRNGLPDSYRVRTCALALTVQGVDRYHANQFIVYRPETAQFLYRDYTPTQVDYRTGALLACATLAAEVTAGCRTQTERAMALLQRGAARVRHPLSPPCGDQVPPDRNLDEEALLHSGAGWCNEQARVFIRLCQVSGIPARIIQLFYSDLTTGHCIAEFHADGRWCMADATYFCVFPGPDGRLLSAADCHDRGVGQLHCGRAYRQRMLQLLARSDAELNFPDAAKAAAWREKTARENVSDETRAGKLNCFAIINYPLPR
ncbi:MAG: transglutaminase domain-containing protein [Kiritimatiellia bacterium]